MYIDDLGKKREFHFGGYIFSFTPVDSNVRDVYPRTMIDITSEDNPRFHESIMSTGYIQACGFTIITTWEYQKPYFKHELTSYVRKLKIHIEQD